MHRLCATDWWRGVHAVVGLIVLAILSASVGLRATDDGNSFVQVTSPATVQLAFGLIWVAGRVRDNEQIPL